MAAANERFSAALASGDVDAAVAADDAFHDVLVHAAANGEIARSLERLMPRLRRLERLRFGSLVGRRSVEQHAAIVERCAAGDVAGAAEAVARELAVPRNPHRSELHVTDAVASPAAGLEAYERFPLLHGPSPVHRLARLTEHLGGPEIWAKREDVNTGVGMGGNKLRKLEYLVADALAQGCDTLVSIGGVQSNHTRSVAAAAAVAGLRARLVQESWVDWPDAVYDRVGNILLSRIMGAEVELVRSEFAIGVKESWQRAIDEVRERGGRPYPIPAGASDHPLGGLGFASFAREVERQEAELGVFFDHVVVCTVTGSTQAGMIAGFAGGERPRRVLGIDASARIEETRAAVARIARDTAQRIGLGRDLRDDEIEVLEGFAGERYGVPVQQTLDAIRLAGRLEGMICDPVYEGKSMAGLVGLVGDGTIPADATVLYVHLGGAPALNAYSALF